MPIYLNYVINCNAEEGSTYCLTLGRPGFVLCLVLSHWDRQRRYPRPSRCSWDLVRMCMRSHLVHAHGDIAGRHGGLCVCVCVCVGCSLWGEKLRLLGVQSRLPLGTDS